MGEVAVAKRSALLKDLPRPPGGTMDPDSPFYVGRETDDRAAAMVLQGAGVTCAIMGPRQIGKSSLLVRTLEHAKLAGKATAFIDFQSFDSETMATSTGFFKTFAATVARRLGLKADLDTLWKQKSQTNQRLCSEFFETQVFPASPRLTLVMDEVDRLYESEFSRDFFAMLRTWHNERAYGTGANVDLFLVSATEPSLFIRNIHESPFNVGETLRILDFTEEQTVELNKRYGNPLKAAEAAEIYFLLSGNPFLTHVAIYYAAAGLLPAKRLLNEDSWESGPFGDHLRNFGYRLVENASLKETFDRAMAGKRCDAVLFERLRGLGLLVGSASNPRPRCDLYRRYYGPDFGRAY